jgi:hypothetical protein
MPPEQIESDITDSYERFFTLGSGIDHIESRSLTGVSVIKIYFQPGTDANAAVSNISNLAMANLRRLPPGTLPPVDSNDDGFQTNPTPFTWQSQHDSIAIGRRCQRYRYANGSRPLSIAPRIRYLRYAKEGGPQPSQQRGGEDRRPGTKTRRSNSEGTRICQGYGQLIFELWHWAHIGGDSRLPHPYGAIRFFF